MPDHFPGPRPVDVPVYCSMTRFALRDADDLGALQAEYAAIANEAKRNSVPGLLKSAFLVEDERTFFSVSIWDSKPIISAELRSHIDAANGVFSKLAYEDGRGPELWSTEWRLTSVTNNLHWSGFDLGQVVDSGRKLR